MERQPAGWGGGSCRLLGLMLASMRKAIPLIIYPLATFGGVLKGASNIFGGLKEGGGLFVRGWARRGSTYARVTSFVLTVQQQAAKPLLGVIVC